ncbi:hypothetical protein X961_5852 [Burkholderia pseudomallei MSHR5613]|nr:hypothetical protein X961_5852 [Burkholderia pseudomallei MSHR5613]
MRLRRALCLVGQRSRHSEDSCNGPETMLASALTGKQIGEAPTNYQQQGGTTPCPAIESVRRRRI